MRFIAYRYYGRALLMQYARRRQDCRLLQLIETAGASRDSGHLHLSSHYSLTTTVWSYIHDGFGYPQPFGYVRTLTCILYGGLIVGNDAVGNSTSLSLLSGNVTDTFPDLQREILFGLV